MAQQNITIDQSTGKIEKMTKLEFLHKVTARLKYNPVWAEILNKTGNTLENKRWIFITGCYNSGTTLLDQILATHPEISGLPDEGVMLTDQLVRPEDFGWRRLWSECENEMESSTRNQQKNAVRIKKHWSHFYDSEKDYLLEKSISNTTRLDFFNENFRPAWFIHIVRNGYAVAEGIHRKAEVMEGNPFIQEGKYPYPLCAKQWVRSLQVFEEHKKKLQNVIEVKYEELAENPSEVVNGILKTMGLKKFPEDYFDKSFTIHEKNSKIKNMNTSSFKRLEAKDVKAINEVAGRYLNTYGYKLLEE